MSAITEGATGFPNNYGAIPKSSATVAEVLKQNGYNTFAVGKWHLTPYWAYTAAGTFDRWPLGKATLVYEFTKTGENVGTGRLFINGKPAGELKDIKTAPIDYAAASEGLQVGRGWSTPVSHDYDGPFAFTGQLHKVVLDVQEK